MPSGGICGVSLVQKGLQVMKEASHFSSFEKKNRGGSWPIMTQNPKNVTGGNSKFARLKHHNI